MARTRLLDVPGHERRPPGARRALRLHQQPQLRRSPGRRWPHPPGEPGHGRRRRCARSLRRHPPIRLIQKETLAMNRITTFLTLSALVALMGCNTVKGLGEDVQKAGSAIENAAKK